MMEYNSSSLSCLESIEGYRKDFMNPILWEPHIRRLFLNHDSTKITHLYPGLAGTYPTFIVNHTYVIKFFGKFFQGENSWHIEQQAANLLQNIPDLPIPKLVAAGFLFEQEKNNWPYLISEYIPGDSIGEKYQFLSQNELENLAFWLGSRVCEIHSISIPQAMQNIFPLQSSITSQIQKNWMRNRGEYIQFPPNLVSQVDSFLAETQGLENHAQNHLIHADITRDHLIGSFENGCWHTHGIIDFGDAMMGNIYYELAAIYLDIFQLKKNLLQKFLQGYGLKPEFQANFHLVALRTALLHQFNVFESLPAGYFFNRGWKSIEDMAISLWAV